MRGRIVHFFQAGLLRTLNWRFCVRGRPGYVFGLGLMALLLFSCTPQPTITPTLTPRPTPTLGQVGVTTTRPPDPEETAHRYLDAWRQEEYALMYSMLTSVSQDAISQEEFEGQYREVWAEGALREINHEIRAALITSPQSAQVNYVVDLESVLVGEIQRETVMNLSLDGEAWRVQWDDTLILPELSGGSYLSMNRLVPSRGNIYDREGETLVAQADAVALGLDTSQVDPDVQESLLNEIWRLTRIHPDVLRPKLENYREYGWYLPIGEVAEDRLAPQAGSLSRYAGMVLSPFSSRYYFEGGIAPHVTGYVSFITVEEVEEYKRKGYRVDEKVGQFGLENWGEEYLSGDRGGALYVVSPEGKILTKLGESEPRAAQEIFTTLDKDLQIGAQQALNGFRGAIVVLERDTGRVLAMVSSPGYDPNLFEPTNLNFGFSLEEMLTDLDRPLFNRATQGQYPLGSVFKIITMSAAMESGLYTADTIYQCGWDFTELPGLRLFDWTYEKELPPSGELTLPEGLMRSCNPFFWHIGLDLYDQGLTTAVADMARQFGFGSATGIGQLGEAEGQILDPENQVDAVNQAIGQGSMQVTPLQVASFIAAFGNGGVIYRPQIIERIEPPDGDPVLTFEPEIIRELPISTNTLETIQGAMIKVVSDARGTARHVFPNFPIPLAGKTGTAQDPPRDPHAWFAGYTSAEREDKPDIAAVVIIENTGEGSDFAAPVFRGVVQLYFNGQRSKFPWETQPGVRMTPTPVGTEESSSEETESS